MRALNRHYTFKWKKRRKEKHGDKCKCAKCLVCHYDKVHKLPSIKLKRENEKTEELFREAEERFSNTLNNLEDEGLDS